MFSICRFFKTKECDNWKLLEQVRRVKSVQLRVDSNKMTHLKM